MREDREKSGQTKKPLAFITHSSLRERSQSDGVWRSTGTTRVGPPPAVVKANLRATRPAGPPLLLLTQALPGRAPPSQAGGLLGFHTRTFAFQGYSSCLDRPWLTHPSHCSWNVTSTVFTVSTGGIPWFLRLISIPHYVLVKHPRTLLWLITYLCA